MKILMITLLILMPSVCFCSSFTAENGNVKVQVNGEFVPSGNITLVIDGKTIVVDMVTFIRLQMAMAYLAQPKITPVEFRIYVPVASK